MCQEEIETRHLDSNKETYSVLFLNIELKVDGARASGGHAKLRSGMSVGMRVVTASEISVLWSYAI